MRTLFSFLLPFMLLPFFTYAQSDYPTYNGSDLGLTYTPQASTFKIWSPIAKSVTIRLYQKGLPETKEQPTETGVMTKGDNGLWIYKAQGDRKGQYYTFQVTIWDGKIMQEVPDPYAKAVGANGKRAQVIDLSKTNPIGWEKDKSPVFEQKTDAILYELHVRDASISPTSGIQQKGKFLGLTETGTTYSNGKTAVSTGLDHIKELGATHVHLLPSYDYFTIDETKINDPNYKVYNWGYDPLNYNTPEGSYATNPYDGAVRIVEFKKMVQAMHSKGLRVVMDVVYNHTMFGEESYFHQLVPFYYHRAKADGTFSNASGCGNETASERPMVRKFMLESLKYWVEEYHIDGFRFDLMGIHDIETMNQISKMLHEIKPSILLYGEGWTAGDSPLPENQRSIKKHTARLDKIAAFSDDLRDGLKGSVFNHTDSGFVSGKSGMEETIKFGIVGATQHPQVNYGRVNYAKEAWAAAPSQCINYPECHDNHTLWDRLLNSNPNDSEQTRIKMHQLAQTIVLTSQGIPFLHAGTEFLRTKNGEENSYKSSDTINALDWARKATYKSTFDYYTSIIALRKKHPAFRMPSTELIQKNLQFLPFQTPNVVQYTLNGAAVGDTWKKILVIFNGNKVATTIEIPKGKWRVILDGNEVKSTNKTILKTETLQVPAISAMILVE
jgi:pullulanase